MLDIGYSRGSWVRVREQGLRTPSCSFFVELNFPLRRSFVGDGSTRAREACPLPTSRASQNPRPRTFPGSARTHPGRGLLTFRLMIFRTLPTRACTRQPVVHKRLVKYNARSHAKVEPRSRVGGQSHHGEGGEGLPALPFLQRGGPQRETHVLLGCLRPRAPGERAYSKAAIGVVVCREFGCCCTLPHTREA